MATDRVSIRIPRTKGGKTETDIFNREKIIETYGIEPKQLIDVKGLQGDTSDNIPGVPGIGEKTALSLVQKFGSIENLYKKIESGEDGLKGKQREKIEENKELAFLSKTLGTINLEVPIEDTLEKFKIEEWDKSKVLEIFKDLNFNRYIERFNLKQEERKENEEQKYKIVDKTEEEIMEFINKNKEMIYFLDTEKDDAEEKIIKEKIISIAIYNNNSNEAYYLNTNESDIQKFKQIFEDKEIKKIGINITKHYILLKQLNINLEGIYYDISIAAYLLNPTNNKLDIESLSSQYVELDIRDYLGEKEEKQINLFENMENDIQKDKEKERYSAYVYAISKIKDITMKELEKINAKDLFFNIEMPTVEVLSNMQWNGMYVDKEELEGFGKELTEKINILTKKIHQKN